MTSDAILRASDDLCQALGGVIPVKGATQTAVDQLMKIFKKQADKGEGNRHPWSKDIEHRS